MSQSSLYTIDAWLPLADALRRTAPEGTRTTIMQASFGRGSWGSSTTDDGDSTRRHENRSRAERDLLHDAATGLMELCDGPSFPAEISVHADGRVEVRLAELPEQAGLGLSGSNLDSVVLVSGAHPEPYRRSPIDYGRPPAPEVDPAAVTAIVRNAIPDAVGVSEAELDAVEAGLGRALPADVRALYLAAASGDVELSADEEADDELFFGFQIIALDDAEGRGYLQPVERYLDWCYGATEVVAADPDDRVQPLALSGAWFPFGDDWGGNVYVVDLAPGPGGSYGQVLFVDHETNSGAQWVASSLTELLTKRPVDLAPEGSTEGLSVWTPKDVTPSTEVLRCRTDKPADLSKLAGHPRLRTLTLPPTQITGLEVLLQLPALEYLEADTATWRRLLDAGLVPARLLAAGFEGRGLFDQIPIANALLASRGGPQIRVTELSGSLVGPEPSIQQPAASPAPRSWWRRLFGR